MAPASPLPLLFLLLSSVLGLSQIQLSTYQSQIGDGLGLSFPLFEQPDCECFNCNLDQFQCQQFANCSKANGKCSCPPGFGGDACSEPLCGSLADGKDRAPRPPDQSTCTCKEGWEGINCNVCKDDRACDSLMPEGKDGVCYKEGVVQHENFQMCDITNRKIIDQLDPRIPQATFSCNREREVCSFQFWIDQVESFYCGFDDCDFNFEAESNRNITKYRCDTVKCACVPGKPLCGEEGTIDITDFLAQEVIGPASFTTISTEGGSSQDGSTFKEPHMDNLISSVFYDESIKLSCRAGECLYKTDVPGYEKPVKKINTPLIAGIIAGCALFVVAVVVLLWYLTHRTYNKGYRRLYLSEDDDANAKLMDDHKPAALHFANVSYNIGGRQILSSVNGMVRPGEMLAVMGASGAGKTTLLDILARKNKRGFSQGDIYINGEKYTDSEFRNVIGFVDQDDALFPTLTVHETIMDSALLRLPKDMSLIAKEQRVEDVEKQLGIFNIRNQLVGSEEVNGRGISGGERRRVGIACELVTSPSILFLDEPTSGLDSFNAYNVVDCLVNLVKTYNRTVIFTIHQPRSNIVARFDQLILLAQGHVVFSGPFSSCQNFFDGIGYPCPAGFNIADFLIDLTMQQEEQSNLDRIIDADRDLKSRSSSVMAVKSINSIERSSNEDESAIENVQGQHEGGIQKGAETPLSQSGDELSPIESSREAQSAWLRLSKQSKNLSSRRMEDQPERLPTGRALPSSLENIVASYADSDVASSVRDSIKATAGSCTSANGHAVNTSPNQTVKLQGYLRIGLMSQFRILSIRTWRNLYRNPFLMLTHYAIAILVAVLVGVLFYGLTDDIAGFQNRLGLFFFILALFGFSTLTTLTVFSTERLLFTRERAKGYYKPVAYFAAKVLFDIVPLRLIPPILLGAIMYPMTGLVPAWPEFLRFMAFLILFNFAASAICLFVGVVFKNVGMANLIGSLIMLFSLLFAGLLLNHDSIPSGFRWLQMLSIFHYGFEGLLINEAKYLSLTDHKYGLDIEVPGSAILSSFGFKVRAMNTDLIGLIIYGTVFIVLAYGAMHVLLVERR